MTAPTSPALRVSTARVIVLLVWLPGTSLAVCGERAVLTQRGQNLPVDMRAFDKLGDPVLDDHAGVLSRGGYCRLGATVQKQRFKLIGEPPRDPIAEVVRHPVDYPFVAHDFIGTLRAAASGAELATRRSPAPNPALEVIDWSAVGASSAQTICVGALEPQARGGIVGWYSIDATSNGLVTVCIRYQGLEGLPAGIIDRYLAEHPSVMDLHTVGRDWIDDDLAKWVQILRSQPDDRLIREIAANFLRNYQIEARQDWGLQNLVTAPAGSDQLKSRCSEVAARVEEWRRFRKQPP